MSFLWSIYLASKRSWRLGLLPLDTHFKNQGKVLNKENWLLLKEFYDNHRNHPVHGIGLLEFFTQWWDKLFCNKNKNWGNFVTKFFSLYFDMFLQAVNTCITKKCSKMQSIFFMQTKLAPLAIMNSTTNWLEFFFSCWSWYLS